ncbi:MAG: undecaprenyl-diphosphate phosphatase [Cyanobacteria bacterium P01_H01_bin.74]
MDLGYSIFKGLVQGLTEFLPISSTAHLTFTQAIFSKFNWIPPLGHGEDEFFDILLHLGTLVSVLYYFRSDLLNLLAVFTGKADPELTDSQSGLILKKLPFFIAISTVVTVVFILSMQKLSGLIMTQLGMTTATVHDLSDYYFAHPHWVGIHLIITGCLLFFSERAAKHLEQGSTGKLFAVNNAVWIGLLQGCAAIFHGVSRSGSTISAALATGIDRTTATRYTFLLSIPVFMMAAVYEGLKMIQLGALDDLNWPVMLVGTAVSAIVGYFCVKYLIQFVANNSLFGFSVYCWVLGATMYVFLR